MKDCSRTSIVNDRTSRFADQKDSIRNSRKYVRAKHWAVDDFLARLSERKQMTSEITAIDSGHIFRV